jgi:hypothetical protein
MPTNQANSSQKRAPNYRTHPPRKDSGKRDKERREKGTFRDLNIVFLLPCAKSGQERVTAQH